MTTLRALKKLILGETWIVPLGLLAILVAGALIHHVASHAWTELGGLALVPGVLSIFCLSVLRTARSR
jgi:hypothetical protein